MRPQAEPLSGNKEIQDFVKAVEQRAKEEAERKPYHRGGVQVDLIGGILFIIGGLLMLWALLRGTFGPSLFADLFFGTAGLAMFFAGVMCLVIWVRSR